MEVNAALAHDELELLIESASEVRPRPLWTASESGFSEACESRYEAVPIP